MTQMAPRWRAEIVYRSDKGNMDVEHVFDELEDLHSIVERGPHWDTIVGCTVTLNRPTTELRSLTIEEAEKL